MDGGSPGTQGDHMLRADIFAKTAFKLINIRPEGHNPAVFECFVNPVAFSPAEMGFGQQYAIIHDYILFLVSQR